MSTSNRSCWLAGGMTDNLLIQLHHTAGAAFKRRGAGLLRPSGGRDKIAPLRLKNQGGRDEIAPLW